MNGRPLGSTYRLQLAGLGFAGARRIVGYLHRLGIQTLYVSPVLAAVPGSTHGYDVVDPTRLDPDLGTDDELAGLLGELAAHQMSLLIDIVPNHMATAAENRWFADVLARGPASPYGRHFDIDWAAADGRVVLAVLAGPLAEVRAAGQLVVEAPGEPGPPELAYADRRLPLDPDGPAGRAGEPVSDEVLGAQHYRLTYWRLGRHLINYRRFFDVDSLIGVRVEDPAVYRDTHRRLLALAADPQVIGVRVDHIDGLADPAAYLERLHRDLAGTGPGRPRVLVEKILARDETLPAGWATEGTSGYEFADLAGGLLVDRDGAAALAAWAAGDGGPTGGFAEVAVQAKRDVLAALFPGPLDRLAADVLATLAAEGASPDLDRADMAAALAELTAQLDVYRTYVDATGARPSDLRRLDRARRAARPQLDAEGRRALDLVVPGLTLARAADRPGADGPAWLDLARRFQQLTGAVAAKGVEDTALYRFDGLVVGAEVGGSPAQPAVDPPTFHRAMALRARRWPESLNATSTHDTKRSEDVRARLAALSEVPEVWASTVDRWSRRHQGLVGSPGPSRHDRLLAYQSIVGVWPLTTAGRRGLSARVAAYLVKAAREAKRETSWLEPDERYERALVGFCRRLLGGADERFGPEVERVVEQIGPAGALNALTLVVLRSTAPGVPDCYQGNELWAPALVDPDNRRPVDYGRREAMLDRLDRAVARRGPAAVAAELLARWPDGRIKLYTTAQLARLRRDRAALFERGTYRPIGPSGPGADHVVALARRRGRDWLVAGVTRRPIGLVGPGRFPVGRPAWGPTRLSLPPGAPRRFHDVLTGAEVTRSGRSLDTDQLFAVLPYAVLVAA
jgi:malto-oligosyltrehalose synthase